VLQTCTATEASPQRQTSELSDLWVSHAL